MKLTEVISKRANYLFLGEAGCGKSELAVNLALALAEKNEKPVHFFDLDMTKPLFRSRDVSQMLEDRGITVHFQEQFMDAPTQVGGLNRLLRDNSCYTILDVGGDYIGASAVGIYAQLLQNTDTVAYYVVNSFRPWSTNLEHIDGVLSQILGASRLSLNNLCFVGNPNFGVRTTQKDVEEGLVRLNETLGSCTTIAFGCVWDELWPMQEESLPLVPLHLYLTYPWEDFILDAHDEDKKGVENT